MHEFKLPVNACIGVTSGRGEYEVGQKWREPSDCYHRYLADDLRLLWTQPTRDSFAHWQHIISVTGKARLHSEQIVTTNLPAKQFETEAEAEAELHADVMITPLKNTGLDDSADSVIVPGRLSDSFNTPITLSNTSTPKLQKDPVVRQASGVDVDTEMDNATLSTGMVIQGDRQAPPSLSPVPGEVASRATSVRSGASADTKVLLEVPAANKLETIADVAQQASDTLQVPAQAVVDGIQKMESKDAEKTGGDTSNAQLYQDTHDDNRPSYAMSNSPSNSRAPTPHLDEHDNAEPQRSPYGIDLSDIRIPPPLERQLSRRQLTVDTDDLELSRRHSPDSWLTLYEIDFLRPQINLQSDTTSSRFVLTASRGRWESLGLPVFVEMEDQLGALMQDDKPVHYEKQTCATLFDAQAWVAPTDVDINTNKIQWVPALQVVNVKCVDVQTLDVSTVSQNITLLRKIVEPCTIHYTGGSQQDIDQQLKHLNLVVSDTLNGIVVQQQPNSTDEQVFDVHQNGKKEEAVLHKSTQLYMPKFDSHMDSSEFWTLISVVQSLFLNKSVEEKERELDENGKTQKETDKYPLPGSDKTHVTKTVEDALKYADAELLNTNKAKQLQRTFQYYLGNVTWELIRNDSPFIVSSLSGALGEHYIYSDNTFNSEMGIRQITMTSCIANNQHSDVVIQPQPQKWLNRESNDIGMLHVRAMLREDLTYFDKSLHWIKVFELLDISIFPLTINIQYEVYALLREYFFPTLNTAKEDMYSAVTSFFDFSKKHKPQPVKPSPELNTTAVAVNRQKATMELIKESSKASKKVQKISVKYNKYFKFVRVSELDFVVSYNGEGGKRYSWLENVKLNIRPFILQNKLSNTDKLVTKIERHVALEVLWYRNKHRSSKPEMEPTLSVNAAATLAEQAQYSIRSAVVALPQDPNQKKSVKNKLVGWIKRRRRSDSPSEDRSSNGTQPMPRGSAMGGSRPMSPSYSDYGSEMSVSRNQYSTNTSTNNTPHTPLPQSTSTHTLQSPTYGSTANSRPTIISPSMRGSSSQKNLPDRANTQSVPPYATVNLSNPPARTPPPLGQHPTSVQLNKSLRNLYPSNEPPAQTQTTQQQQLAAQQANRNLYNTNVVYSNNSNVATTNSTSGERLNSLLSKMSVNKPPTPPQQPSPNSRNSGQRYQQQPAHAKP